MKVSQCLVGLSQHFFLPLKNLCKWASHTHYGLGCPFMVLFIWSQKTLHLVLNGSSLPSSFLFLPFSSPSFIFSFFFSFSHGVMWLYLTLPIGCLAVQWLRLLTSTAGGMGSIPGWWTKIPHAMKYSHTHTHTHRVNGLYLYNMSWNFLISLPNIVFGVIFHLIFAGIYTEAPT